MKERFHKGHNNVEDRSIQICPWEQVIPETLSKPNPSLSDTQE